MASGSRRWWALGAITLAVLAVTLDVTVLAIATPTLAAAFRASESGLQWFITAYTLALVAAMLPAGLIGDRWGHRAAMVAALALFTAGSVVCAEAPSGAVFIVGRVAVGIAGAGIVVGALALVTVLFDEAERPRAVGIWAAANFIGLPLGPVVGGWLLSHAWWGWIFLMNVPVALLGGVAVLALVAPSRPGGAPHVDGWGLVLSTAGLVGVMYAVIAAGDGGWSRASVIVSLLGGVAAFAAFAAVERHVAGQPGRQALVDVGLFRARSFTWAIILTAIGVTGLFGVMFVLPQYAQAVRGLDPQGSGLRLLPVVAGLIAGAVPADRVSSRFGAKLTVAAGFAVAAAGMGIGTGMTAGSGDGFLAVWTLVAGAGSGLAFATAASAALVELPAERSGVGSGLLQAVTKLGPAFGASVLGSVLNAGYQHGLDVRGLPAAVAAGARTSAFAGIATARQVRSPALLASVRAAFVAGMDRSLAVAALVAVAGTLVALAFLPGRGQPVRR